MGKCANPDCTYTFKYKPFKCLVCDAYIGGKVTPIKSVKKKSSVIKVTELEKGVFSVHCHCNYRTIVSIDENGKSFCSSKDCCEKLEVKNQSQEDYDCSHVSYISSEEHNESLKSWTVESVW